MVFQGSIKPQHMEFVGLTPVCSTVYAENRFLHGKEREGNLMSALGRFVRTTVSIPLAIAGVAVGAHVLLQSAWIAAHLLKSDVRRSLATRTNTAPRGISSETFEDSPLFTRQERIEDGIEWISYLPKHRRHETPILMQHGMWHGAWCWQQWQELLAEWGWESHAISLPGHGRSPEQRPIAACTLDYYLSFIRDAANCLPQKPVLMGHSMGGALTQWYLKYVGDLPAAVLVAPWALYKGFVDSFMAFVKVDPVGMVTSGLRWKADFVRSPENAAAALIGPGAIYTPEELYSRLGPESVLVMMQHPFWQMPDHIDTPMLWLGGELDAVVPERAQRRSAAGYGADYVMVPDAAHNLMMEHNYHDTALLICDWLEKRNLG